MPDRRLPSPEDADEIYRRLLSGAGQEVSTLTAHEAWRHFGEFAQIPFELPSVPMSDGLLYQYGISDLPTEPRRFNLSFVRQFAVPDEDEFLQFDCRMSFTPNAELDALGYYNEWWWPSDGIPLAEWLAAISSRPEWRLLRTVEPVSVEIYVDET